MYIGYQGKPRVVLLQSARNGAVESSYSQPSHMESKVLQRFGDKHIKGSQRIFQWHGQTHRIPFKYSGAEDDRAIKLVSVIIHMFECFVL